MDSAASQPAEAPLQPFQAAAPSFFMCIELFPLMPDPKVLDDLNTAQLFEVASTSPHLFRREWAMFRTLEEAEEYAGRSATLTVLPIVVAHEPLLGY